MSSFPRNELEIVALAEQMIAGYTTHPADFPSIEPAVELTALQAALTNLQNLKQNQENAISQAQIATATKGAALVELVRAMKSDLKLSEVDTVTNPEKLTEIGWGPKSPAVPITAPNTPNNLTAVFGEGNGTISLEWDKSLSDPNKPVMNYIVERREQLAPKGAFTEWRTADTVYYPKTQLTGQPTMTKMEYRVFASNPAGRSLPSNTFSAVL
jgi:hypothetical protein